MPPIEVTLRNDGAELSVEAMENGKPADASVLVYSEEYPRSSFAMTVRVDGKLELHDLRPGPYRVLALKGVQELEFRDPLFLQEYLSQGKEVNLRPGDQVHAQVEVVSRAEDSGK